MSKAERGFMLTADYHPLPVRAAVLQFPPDATLDDAVEVVISSAFFANSWRIGPRWWKRNIWNRSTKLRVALRRLRTALAFFDRVLPCAEFKVFRAEAKRIASALGPARNWDAFRELVEDGPCTLLPLGESFEAH